MSSPPVSTGSVSFEVSRWEDPSCPEMTGWHKLDQRCGLLIGDLLFVEQAAQGLGKKSVWRE